MKLLFVLLSVVAVSHGIHTEWQKFKTTHGRQYKTPEEESYRLQVFKDNMDKIKTHNARYDAGLETYYLGVTTFADITEEEYMELTSSGEMVPDVNTTVTEHFELPGDLPASVDWRAKGAVTPIRNQLPCGACYAFAATACLESLHFLRTKKLYVLSPQNLVDCSYAQGDHGCKGGYMDRAYRYIKEKGIMTEKDYPYVSKENPTCSFDPKKSVVKVAGSQIIPGEDNMEKLMAGVGPIGTGADGKEWQLYIGGVFVAKKPFAKLSHGVTVIGYGYDSDVKLQYWLIKNSYGPYWGEQGFMRLAKNKGNQCGIATSPVLPTF